MILYPAIDLKNNQCVRLEQGQINRLKTYSSDPVLVARSFVSAGAKAIHIVDLDGAVSNNRINGEMIRRISENLSIPVSVGGGIRTLEDAEALLEMGVKNIIIGTVAIENMALLTDMIKRFKDRLVVSIDAKDGFVATRGWTNFSGRRVIELAIELETLGVKTIVATDISKDGMLTGPNIGLYKELKDQTNLNIIASGGVSSLEDLQALNRLSLDGVIIGKALYENKFTLQEALTCLQSE